MLYIKVILVWLRFCSQFSRNLCVRPCPPTVLCQTGTCGECPSAIFLWA